MVLDRVDGRELSRILALFSSPFSIFDKDRASIQVEDNGYIRIRARLYSMAIHIGITLNLALMN